MLKANELYEFFDDIGIDFYTGVPDSTLKNFLNVLEEKKDKITNIIAANEGNSVGLASGYYISNKKVAVVYLQNSGIGNIINPVTSLTEVYDIPIIYVIGWRGRPGKKDEPQHEKMGMIMKDLLHLIDVDIYDITDKTTIIDIKEKWNNDFKNKVELRKSVAFVIEPDSLEKVDNVKYENNNTIVREELINQIVDIQDSDDIIVSTTGKASRELFEIREQKNQTHDRDFLTVGSMGHCSSIALGISNSVNNRVWCLDGDGAAIMHMGAIAILGNQAPKRFIYVMINNGSHESVGGMKTVAEEINWEYISKACKFENYYRIEEESKIKEVLIDAKNNSGLTFIEVKVKIGSRNDLGRPTITPLENINKIINYLNESKE